MVKPSQEGESGEENGTWIECYERDRMWYMLIKLTPNKAVFDSTEQFNVSVKASDWSPFGSGLRNFYFNLSRVIRYKITMIGEFPQFVAEETVPIAGKNVSVYKSEDENFWEVPIFNFTITLDTETVGMHIYMVEGLSQDVLNPEWRVRGWTIFSINVGVRYP